ncbi:hypothetical protein D3C87_1517930 [compost metagenome]
MVANSYAFVVDLLGFSQGVNDLRGSRQAGRRLELVSQLSNLLLRLIDVGHAIVDALAKLPAGVKQLAVGLSSARL